MMTDVLNQLFTVPNAVFCLMIWAAVLIQRKIVETLWKKAVTNKIWNSLVLPIWPMVTGGLLIWLVKAYPVPPDFAATGPRIIFGVVCGLLSAHVYKIVKELVSKQLSSNTTTNDPTDLLDQ